MSVKFRGKSTAEYNKGQWIEGYLIQDGISLIVNGIIESNSSYVSLEEWCSVDENTIGQFTGVLSETFEEIFDGDIVKMGYFEDGDFKTITGRVQFLEGQWVINNGEKAVSLWREVESAEVLGNIYDNKDL